MNNLLEADLRRNVVVKLRPHRLWSLWDMREHDAKSLLRACKNLMRAISLVNSSAEGKADIDTVLSTLGTVKRQCDDVGLTVSATMANESQYGLKGLEGASNRIIIDELETLHSVIEGELRSILFLQLRSEFAKYYKETQIFGSDVSDKFPSAIQDIEEGGKALACGLGTACVFHMMRVMEVGLKSLGSSLKIPYAPSWESYIKQIEAKITAKHRTKGIQWKRDEPYFRDILGDLQAVKIAWRNPTMHIVRHYDQDEAEDVLRAVRRFMIRLSERHSE